MRTKSATSSHDETRGAPERPPPEQVPPPGCAVGLIDLNENRASLGTDPSGVRMTAKTLQISLGLLNALQVAIAAAAGFAAAVLSSLRRSARHCAVPAGDGRLGLARLRRRHRGAGCGRPWVMRATSL